MKELEYIKQNAEGMDDVIRRIGCFWRVGTHVGELLSGERFTRPEELNALWAESLLLGYMLDKGTGPELHKGVVPIIDQTLDYFGCTRKVVEIGSFESGETRYLQWYKNEPIMNPGERFFVQKMKLGQQYVEPYHYRLVDNLGQIRFDPYEPSPVPAGIEYSIILEEI